MSEQCEAKKAELVARIDQLRVDLEALLSDAGEAGLERPGAAGDWTLRDVIAHLNGWRERTLLRLEAAAAGRDPAPPPWPSDLDGDSEDDVDTINLWFYERSRDRSADEVVAESWTQLARMRALVGEIAAQDLFTPGRYAWLGSHSLADVPLGSLEHFYEEHVPMLRAWQAETA